MPRHVVVLAGGLGTRLASVLPDRPKPLALINGRPFLEWLLLRLRSLGAQSATLCTGHLADQIENHFGDGARIGLQLNYSRERMPLGTGGALRLALETFDADPFFACNGDSFCMARLSQLAECYEANRAACVIALVRNPDPERFGSVLLDDRSRVIAFGEKQPLEHAYANGGVYLMSRAIFEPLPPGPASLEVDVFPGLVQRGLYGCLVEGDILDIGTPESLRSAAAHAMFSDVLEVSSQLQDTSE